nr:MAG: RNA-dependent RNA polymerase [Crogonang virus 20]
MADTQKISQKGNLLELKPRVKGDLAIRRMRIQDLQRSCPLDIWTYFEENMCMHDVITVTNLIAWTMIWGLDKLKDLHNTGMLNDVETLRTVGSSLSAYVKRFPNDVSNVKRMLAEFNCLTGYLQNDPADFDFKEDFEALATGGNQNDDVDTFKVNMRRIMTPQPAPSYISFEEYIRRGLWMTAGASSIGEVEWEYDGDSGTFKARKNMVLDIYTADEIVELARSWDGKLINSVFTKDELAKRRLAVASNLAAYLNQSWMMRLFGHGFKNWNYVTLDERPNEGFDRTSEIQKLLSKGNFALPWDYKGFDRQPNTWEVKLISERVGELCRTSVPVGERAEFDIINKKVNESYENNYLIAKQQKLEAKQTGGIPSGIRPTSFIGNIWNAIKTEQVVDMCETVFGKNIIQTIGLRGDDTYIISRSPVALLFFRYGYASLDVLGNNSKFGIMQNCCEFLRQNITPDEVHGWPNRAIPSVFQRKPWNPQPWKPGSDVTTTTNNIYLLERRLGFACPDIHKANKLKWSKFVGQSTRWLELPVRMGGFGLYPFAGWVPDCSLPTTTQPVIRIEDLKTDRPPTWIDLSPNELKTYYQNEFSQKIAADDVRGPQKHFGIEFLRAIRLLRPKWSTVVVETFPVRHMPIGPILGQVWPAQKHVNQNSSTLGYPIFSEFIRQFRVVSKIRDIKLSSIMEQHYNAIYTRMKQFERQGFHRTDAINLATGSIPTEPTKILNPILSPFVADSLVKNGLKNWKHRDRIAKKMYYYTTTAVDALQRSCGYHLFAY